MKKKLSVMLALVLVLSFVLSGAAFADDISVSVSGGGTGVIGENSMTLTGNVTSSATDLEYMWYSSRFNNIAAINSLGVSSLSYTPPQTSGTTYYCLGAHSLSGGSWVYSDLVAVTYNNGTMGISIVSRPNKWQYYVGENIDLTGLAVEITTAGGTWTAYNGADVSVSPTTLTAEGEVVINVSYDGYTASFGVTVAPHTHSYSAWTVTKAATCTSTGVRTRTCSCGSVQNETIAKTAHSWNAGTVNNGVKTYTCKVCGTTMTEKVTASPSPSPTATPKPTATPTPHPTITPVAGATGTTGGTTGGTSGTVGTVGGVSGTVGTNGTSGTSGTVGTNGTVGANGTSGNADIGTQKSSSGFKWWIIPLVAASVGVVAGGGAYMYLTFVKKQ